MEMGSGPSASTEPEVLTLNKTPSPTRSNIESDLDTSIPKFDTSWSDDDDLDDVECLRRDLDGALQSSPRRKIVSPSANSHETQRSEFSSDSRFLMDSAEDCVNRKDLPETYAQKIQRVQLEDQQPPLLVHADHVMVPRDPVDWELEEDQILGFDVTKFKAVNKVENNLITQSDTATSPQSTTRKVRSAKDIEYDRFEEEIMAAIERDF